MWSVALLAKALLRWPSRTWSAVTRGVPVPTSTSMDGSAEEAVTFTCGRAFGAAAHAAAPRVRLSAEHRARLAAALASRRQLYDGNPHAARRGDRLTSTREGG